MIHFLVTHGGWLLIENRAAEMRAETQHIPLSHARYQDAPLWPRIYEDGVWEDGVCVSFTSKVLCI